MTDADIRTVTKRELVNRIAEETGQTKVVVRDVLQRFLNEIIDELADGNRLEFREFGVFEVRGRKARTAQNPRTLEKVDVPAKRVVKFKVGRVMRQRVCEDIEEGHAENGQVGRSNGSALNGSAAGAGQAAGATKNGPAGGGSGTDGSSAEEIESGENARGGADSRGIGEGTGHRPQPPTPPPAKPGSPF